MPAHRAILLLAAWLCAITAVLAPRLCAAQPADRRPAFAQREARVFDFEEIESSPAPVPMFWVRAQDSPGAGRTRPGFPIWNAAELDGTHAHAGAGAVKLPTRGGSTSLLLERGVLPVFQRADYVLTAQVFTESIRHARARVVARLLDADGSTVPGSERTSPLIISEGRWTQARVEVPGDFDGASFLQIELQLLQPDQYLDRTLGNRQVYEEDFEGAAWFDDVSVAQLPRIEIRTAVDTNVFIQPATPDLNFLVRDLTGERLTVHLAVADSRGTIVDQETRQLTTGRTLAAWKPAVTSLGWYRATLTVKSDATELASTYVDFIWIGPQQAEEGRIGRELSGAGADWQRFELVAVDPHPLLSSLLVDLLSRVGVGAVTVPLWEGLYDAQGKEAGAGGKSSKSASLITRLLERGKQVTLSLPRLPKDLAESAKVDPEDPWELARRGPELWGPFVDRYLDRFGQSIRRWEIGPPWDDRVFWDQDRKKTLASVVRIFERLVPGPILCVPWRADLAATDEVLGQLPREATLRTFVPEDMPSGALASLVPAKKAPRGHDLTVVLGTSFDSRVGMREGAAETTRRLAEFWRLFGDDPTASVALLQPWTWSQETSPQLDPKPELAALASMIKRLGGRRFVGELPAAPGIRALVFSPQGNLDADDQGVLIAWNETGMPRVTLRAYLGLVNARAYDIFSNPITPGAEDDPDAVVRTVQAGAGRTPEVLLNLTDEPIIVEGVDPRLALFQAGVRIEPPFIEASAKVHSHSIVVQNPWPVPVEVNIRVIKPGGVDGADARRDRSWRVTPRQARVVVDPGKEERIPVELSFSPGEEAGVKEFVMDVDAAADQPLGSLRIHREVELGSAVLDMQLSARMDENQNVLVETYVSNRGAGPVDLQLTAFAPGLSRTKSVITNLLPGSVGVRAFRYDRAASLRGQRVYVTLEDVAGSVRLNKAVAIE